MAGETPEKGDKVSWNWGPSGTQPSGVVSEKKTEGEVSVTSHRGNTITKKAEPGDPAVALERSGNNVVKKQSEVEVEEKGAKPELKDKSKSASRTGTPAKGTKRKAEDSSEKKEEANGDKAEEKDEKKDEKKEDKKEEDKSEEKADDKKEEAPANKKAGRPAKAKEDKPAPKANGEKKKPGRPPKDPNAPPAAKKQKKEPREGTRRSSRLKD